MKSIENAVTSRDWGTELIEDSLRIFPNDTSNLAADWQIAESLFITCATATTNEERTPYTRREIITDGFSGKEKVSYEITSRNGNRYTAVYFLDSKSANAFEAFIIELEQR